MYILYDSASTQILSSSKEIIPYISGQGLIETSLPYPLEVFKDCYKVVNGYLVKKHSVPLTVDKNRIIADGNDECIIKCESSIDIGNIYILVNEIRLPITMTAKNNKYVGTVKFSTTVKGKYIIKCEDKSFSSFIPIVEAI